jgi:hypothetical protein
MVAMPDRVEVTVIKNGGKDFLEVPTRDEAQIAAILSDRAGYIAGGHLHLIPAIDETLAFLGYEGDLPAYGNETKPKRNGGQ